MNINATILGQLISFILFVWFCMKFIWPPIILAVETRQKKIKESLVSAENAKKEFLLIQEKIKQEIKCSQKKAVLILNEANNKKLLILERAKAKAIEESKKIFKNNQLEINRKMIDARKTLQKEIIDSAILIAEKIIEKNIQKDENKDLIDKLIFSLSEIKN